MKQANIKIQHSTKLYSKKCKWCKGIVKGRSDKIFCSATCKAEYHTKLKAVTSISTRETDKILHRNRSSLLEIMGKNAKQKTVDKLVLDKKNFKYEYMTGYYENAQGKRYHIVYDFAWMKFKEGKILIIRRNNK